MIIYVAYESPEGGGTIEADINTAIYTLNLKEQLAVHHEPEISRQIYDNGGPYSPDVILSFKGIELNNMFAISRYGIRENDTIELSFACTVSDMPENSPVEETGRCSVCGKKFNDSEMLKYHKGRLSPYEWVYGLTVKWQWTCCGRIVSTPESCYHPEGCSSGVCPGCRPGCACNHARAIRREEEENF